MVQRFHIVLNTAEETLGGTTFASKSKLANARLDIHSGVRCLMLKSNRGWQCGSVSRHLCNLHRVRWTGHGAFATKIRLYARRWKLCLKLFSWVVWGPAEPLSDDCDKSTPLIRARRVPIKSSFKQAMLQTCVSNPFMFSSRVRMNDLAYQLSHSDLARRCRGVAKAIRNACTSLRKSTDLMQAGSQCRTRSMEARDSHSRHRKDLARPNCSFNVHKSSATTQNPGPLAAVLSAARSWVRSHSGGRSN